uniref:Uncharacterized protein n=1 Tax=Arundo donax TaxID=35708 RepID=A0A0A8ZSM6_ARUDO
MYTIYALATKRNRENKCPLICCCDCSIGQN